MKKLLVFILSLTLLVPTLWAQQGVQGKNVELGSFLPLSGAVGFIGQGVKEGIETYVKYFNAELKLNGHQLRMHFVDDQFVAEKSVQAARDLIENKKVFALVGSVGTPGIVASMDYIAGKGIPYIYHGSGVPVLYDPPKKNVFPVQPSYIGEGRVMVKFIADFLKKKKIVLIYQNDEAGQGALDGMNELLPQYRRRGVTLLDKIPINLTDSDFSPVIARVKNLNPDAVVVFAMGGRATGIVKSARDAGMNLKKTPFLTTYVNSDPIMFKLAGNSWNDVYVAAWAAPTTGDYFKNFMRVWKQYSGLAKDPSPYNIAGWIAMEVFIEGMKRTKGALNWANYIKAMETFHEGGGWPQDGNGMAYRLSYKPWNANDKTCRLPQSFLYFVYGEKKQYQLYKKAKNLEDLFIPTH